MNKKRIRKLKREYKELTKRIANLTAFMNTDEYRKLSVLENDMLICQYHAMNTYSIVLNDRISYYDGRPTIFKWRC